MPDMQDKVDAQSARAERVEAQRDMLLKIVREGLEHRPHVGEIGKQIRQWEIWESHARAAIEACA